MLAGARILTARAGSAHTAAIARPLFGPRLLRAATAITTTRACHSATGEFTNLAADGTPVTKPISIRVGDPGEAYVLIPTEVGFALRNGRKSPSSTSNSPYTFFDAVDSSATTMSSDRKYGRGEKYANRKYDRGERYALTYHHDSKHFAVEDSPPGLPRLTIPQQLPRQSDANTSPATLFVYGVMHTIALDGTADAQFAEIASTILPDIGHVLDKLKDM